jgi:NhaP-type Na+/H+ or K+/H+ antiporter
MSLMFLLVLISVICGVVCRAVARRRGLDPVFWLVMGVAFGPLALPLVLLTDWKKA